MTISDLTRATINRCDVITLAEKRKIREISAALDVPDYSLARHIINEGGGAAFTLAERKMLLRLCGAEDGGDTSTTTANLQDTEKTRKRIQRVSNIPTKAKGFWKKYWKTAGENISFVDLSTDLVAWYDFEDETDSAGSKDLTADGVPDHAAGKVDNAVILDTADSYLRADDAFALTGSSFFIGGWFLIPSSPYQNNPIMAYGTTTGGGNNSTDTNWALYLNGANELWFRTSSGTFHTVNGGTVTQNAWHLVVMHHDADAGEIGIQIDNGDIETISAADTPRPSADTLLIGGYWANYGYDSVGFWSRAIEDKDRTELWNGGEGIAFSDL